MSTQNKPFSLYENLPKNTVRHMGYVGIHRILKPRVHFTSLEQKYYMMLKTLNVFYVPQYKLDGRFFDAYLPDYNLLVEFDGSFWHPETVNDCKYECQKKNYVVDKLKNEIAKRSGHKILRIRENKPVTMQELRQLLKESKL
jgi:very-short-patch-repair endonuclease